MCLLNGTWWFDSIKTLFLIFSCFLCVQIIKLKYALPLSYISFQTKVEGTCLYSEKDDITITDSVAYYNGPEVRDTII